jgi:1-acyl-sn-glycerol-3-phosphate acyltransferase
LPPVYRVPAPALIKFPFRVLYGLYCWAAFLVLSVLALVSMLLIPGVEQRRQVARLTSRACLRAAGMRLRVQGDAAVPPTSCVVVANHVSYLDGFILIAALPPRFGFVIKKEMERIPLASLLLRRIGSEFVDRVNRHKGAVDARRMLRRASSGQSFVFFPEGTFSKQPGLLRFHTGAFATAMRAECAVIPVVIKGARTALPWNRIVPTPTVIEVDVLPALHAKGDDGEAAVQLRDEARRMILARLGEPDLASVAPPVLASDAA